MRTLAGRVAARFLAVLITVAGVSGVASAQQMQASATSELLGFFVRGVDSAFDPVTRTYLVVGGAGTLLGICINEQGVPITGPMVINNTGYGAFPRARYGAGGFLVVWPEEVGNPSQLHARTVNCSGAVGPEQVISGDATAWLESGAALAYSPTSQRFLVAWKSFPAPTPVRIKATLVDLNGTQFGPVVDLSSRVRPRPRRDVEPLQRPLRRLVQRRNRAKRQYGLLVVRARSGQQSGSLRSTDLQRDSGRAGHHYRY